MGNAALKLESSELQAVTPLLPFSAKRLSAFLELSKPRINLLILVTTAIGFFLGGQGIFSWPFLVLTLLGTSLTCGGAAVLNNYIERDSDIHMKRTSTRPIQVGTIKPHEALAFGITLVLCGTVILVTSVNLLTGFLALLTAFLYVLVYTPLKKVTWLNTIIGAIPGALPPVGGWAAATGNVSLGAWVLFAILFLWQHPHFYAIAWMYKEDYARGGFKMLPVVEPDGTSTFRQVIITSLLLIPVAAMPTFIGLSGNVYLVGSIILGLGLLAYGIKVSASKTVPDARKLLRASIVYLPILLILIVTDASF